MTMPVSDQDTEGVVYVPVSPPPAAPAAGGPAPPRTTNGSTRRRTTRRPVPRGTVALGATAAGALAVTSAAVLLPPVAAVAVAGAAVAVPASVMMRRRRRNQRGNGRGRGGYGGRGRGAGRPRLFGGRGGGGAGRGGGGRLRNPLAGLGGGGGRGRSAATPNTARSGGLGSGGGRGSGKGRGFGIPKIGGKGSGGGRGSGGSGTGRGGGRAAGAGRGGGLGSGRGFGGGRGGGRGFGGGGSGRHRGGTGGYRGGTGRYRGGRGGAFGAPTPMRRGRGSAGARSRGHALRGFATGWPAARATGRGIGRGAMWAGRKMRPRGRIGRAMRAAGAELRDNLRSTGRDLARLRRAARAGYRRQSPRNAARAAWRYSSLAGRGRMNRWMLGAFGALSALIGRATTNGARRAYRKARDAYAARTGQPVQQPVQQPIRPVDTPPEFPVPEPVRRPVPPVPSYNPAPAGQGGSRTMIYPPYHVALDYYSACARWSPGSESGALFTGLEPALPLMAETACLIANGTKKVAENAERDLGGGLKPEMAAVLAEIFRLQAKAAQLALALSSEFNNIQAEDVRRAQTPGAHTANVPVSR